jgi:hypothetical protein
MVRERDRRTQCRKSLCGVPSPIRGNNPRMTNDPRVEGRADELLPEEVAAGSDDPEAQAEAILEESDERQAEGSAASDAAVEHRTSDEATPPAG